MAFIKVISKSQFTTSLQCKKAFWLYRNRPDLRSIPSAQLKRMEAGTTFGILMQERFPGGVMIPYLDSSFNGSIEKTHLWLTQHDRPIYEASLMVNFEGLPLMCMIDILVPNGSGWDIVEVKSSTRVKEEQIPDAAFQLFISEQLGLEIKKVSILHINNQYVRQGPIDVFELGSISDVTTQVRDLQADIAREVRGLEDLVHREMEPEVLIGPHCDSPYTCGFKSWCWKDVPTPSVFDLFPAKKAHDLYSRGFITPEEVPNNEPLTDREQRRMKSVLEGKELFDTKAVQGFLQELKFPFHYLDFETFMPTIPEFNGTRPYQQIPFQYSLHIQESPDSPIQHKEFLAAADGSDPRPGFLSQLLNDLGQTGSIITYNQTFELTRLRELAVDFPKFEDQIDQIMGRVVDLLKPFAAVDVYHPDMMGSASIKSVLPALVPDLSYSDLEIANGQDAMNTFQEMLNGMWIGDELDQKRKELLEYCKLDTLAMVRLVEYLREKVES
ncbi:MAG: DUF2779 domain-containing protein [Bacteroidota bacterium]|nr:DUF2779 domain-containing protein [Bacteroidota bacterium]